MDTRPPPFHPHQATTPGRSHEHPQYGIPPSPYRQDSQRSFPPPPPPPPPTLQQDPFYRPQRQTFESIAASTPRPDTRSGPSYVPPPPTYSTDQYQRDGRDVAVERREGYGLKRSHDQAMAGEPMENGRPGSRRLHFDEPHAAPGHQHPPPFAHTSQALPNGASPAHPPNQHAPDHQHIGHGNMYQAPVSRSPPPPSPYGGRPMPPPGSPQYGQSQYSPRGQPQGPLPPPPFPQDPGMPTHRAGLSLASILGTDPPRPPSDPRYGHMNGAQTNGQPHYGERDGQRAGPPYIPYDGRSQTPDRFAPRSFDYNRPSRALSTGERPPYMSDRSPERHGFGPPLGHQHELPHSQRGPLPLHPHNSAPGSRRQSVSGVPGSSMSRPQTSVGPASGPEQLHHLPGPPFDHVNSHPRDPRDFAREFHHRPPPPPMPPVEELRDGPPYSHHERRIWEPEQARPSYHEEPVTTTKPINYPFFTSVQQPQQLPPRSVDGPRGLDPTLQQTNGDAVMYGPEPRPNGFLPDLDKHPLGDARKSSVDSLPNHYSARLESPLQRHRHVMDRTNSTRSEHTPSRLLGLSNEHRHRAASPLPQAVQGAQAPAKGPATEPGIKNEFGRMFAGLGGVTPTPTPVELVHKRYSSPADDAPGGGRSTPGLGSFSAKRTNSRMEKRRKDREDALDGEIDSPTDIPRSVGAKGLKRSRNSYIEGLGIHRGDTGSPFGRRAYTPTLLAHASRRERKPRTIVRSQAVLDAVKDRPRKHLGSMLYQIQIEATDCLTSYGGESSEKYGFGAAPVPIPKFEDKENCTFTVRVPRDHLMKEARTEICERRNIWGTEVYTDDSDPLAAAIHSGWVRGEWRDAIDISMLNIGKEKVREEKVNNNAIGPNGRTSLSVSVSPELSRKSLAPYANGAIGGNTSGSDQELSRKNSEASPGASDGKDTGSDIMTSIPNYPMIPPAGKDAHITLLLLPRLQQYASTVQNGIKSRSWTTAHDGCSFMVHSVQFVDEGIEGRRDGRGADAKHSRMQGFEKQNRGMKRKVNSFSRNLSGNNGAGVVAAVGA